MNQKPASSCFLCSHRDQCQRFRLIARAVASRGGAGAIRWLLSPEVSEAIGITTVLSMAEDIFLGSPTQERLEEFLNSPVHPTGYALVLLKGVEAGLLSHEDVREQVYRPGESTCPGRCIIEAAVMHSRKIPPDVAWGALEAFRWDVSLGDIAILTTHYPSPPPEWVMEMIRNNASSSPAAALAAVEAARRTGDWSVVLGTARHGKPEASVVAAKSLLEFSEPLPGAIDALVGFLNHGKPSYAMTRDIIAAFRRWGELSDDVLAQLCSPASLAVAGPLFQHYSQKVERRMREILISLACAANPSPQLYRAIARSLAERGKQVLLCCTALVGSAALRAESEHLCKSMAFPLWNAITAGRVEEWALSGPDSEPERSLAQLLLASGEEFVRRFQRAPVEVAALVVRLVPTDRPGLMEAIRRDRRKMVHQAFVSLAEDLGVSSIPLVLTMMAWNSRVAVRAFDAATRSKISCGSPAQVLRLSDAADGVSPHFREGVEAFVREWVQTGHPSLWEIAGDVDILLKHGGKEMLHHLAPIVPDVLSPQQFLEFLQRCHPEMASALGGVPIEHLLLHPGWWAEVGARVFPPPSWMAIVQTRC